MLNIASVAPIFGFITSMIMLLLGQPNQLVFAVFSLSCAMAFWYISRLMQFIAAGLSKFMFDPGMRMEAALKADKRGDSGKLDLPDDMPEELKEILRKLESMGGEIEVKEVPPKDSDTKH